MTLIDIGTNVFLKIGKIQGMITAICIRHQGYCTYEITYTLNGEPKTTWAVPIEFDVVDSNYVITVGFQNGKSV